MRCSVDILNRSRASSRELSEGCRHCELMGFRVLGTSLLFRVPASGASGTVTGLQAGAPFRSIQIQHGPPRKSWGRVRVEWRIGDDVCEELVELAWHWNAFVLTRDTTDWHSGVGSLSARWLVMRCLAWSSKCIHTYRTAVYSTKVRIDPYYSSRRSGGLVALLVRNRGRSRSRSRDGGGAGLP
jgi:hypothetical protein